MDGTRSVYSIPSSNFRFKTDCSFTRHLYARYDIITVIIPHAVVALVRQAIIGVGAILKQYHSRQVSLAHSFRLPKNSKQDRNPEYIDCIDLKDNRY